MTATARRLLSPGACDTAEGRGCVREVFVPGVTECPTQFGRGLCVTEAVESGGVVIERTRVRSPADANTFTATEVQMGRLLDALGDRDDLRCSLALWCYPDAELAEEDTVYLPLGFQGLINHGGTAPRPRGAGNDATISCAFDAEHHFVRTCKATRAIAAGEEIRFDYYNDFPSDPDWFTQFKVAAGISATLTSHGETWTL